MDEELEQLLERISANYHGLNDAVSVEIWHNRAHGFMGAIKDGHDRQLTVLWNYAPSPAEVVHQLTLWYEQKVRPQ